MHSWQEKQEEHIKYGMGHPCFTAPLVMVSREVTLTLHCDDASAVPVQDY